MKSRKILALLLALCMVVAFVAACGGGDDAATPTPGSGTTPGAGGDATPAGGGDGGDERGGSAWSKPDWTGSVPRNETLYWNGFQWGASYGWNPAFGDDMNNPLAINQDPDGARLGMMETAYMYNMLDGKMYPLLADGGVDGYTWNADKSELSFKIKPAAYWSDGTPVTANDFAATWRVGLEYSRSGNAGWTPYIDDVVAADELTVVVKVRRVEYNGDMVPFNEAMNIQWLGQVYCLQEAWLNDLIERNDGDTDALYRDKAEDLVFSGPYGPFHLDDTTVILARNDNYWGQDASMWGKLPAPTYISNINYETNAAGDSVFITGDVDISQQFIGNVQNYWLEQNLPVSTYLPEAPYHISANMPTAYFNQNSSKVGLDNAVVRKAIAIAVDYDMILANAMTGQSPSFAEVPRSLMNPTAPEQAMYDQSAVSHLQWVGKDIDGANALLDEAGILRNPDNGGPDGGWREIDGVVLSYNACSPNGWSDWNASMEIVVSAGQAIGIQIESYTPEWDVYQTVFTLASQDEYDIFMFSTQGISPAQPYSRIRALLGADFRGIDGNWNGNFGQYFNDRVLEILEILPLETQANQKALYTELVEIYLTEVPSFSLMYRPEKFHTVNESVWTGFTEAGDGRNVPPVNCITGYAIADLYNLTLVG